MFFLARVVSGKQFFDVFYPPKLRRRPGSLASRHKAVSTQRRRSLPASAVMRDRPRPDCSCRARQEIIPDRKLFVSFPTTLGEWRGRASSLDPQTEHFLGLTDYILVGLREERRPLGQSVRRLLCKPAHRLLAAFAQRLHSRQRLADHRPRADAVQQQRCQRVVAVQPRRHRKGSNKQLVYYWFEERGMKIANEYWSKLYLLRDALFENRTDGALVRLTTPVYPGEAEADADKRLQDFMQIAVPSLAPYLPAPLPPTRNPRRSLKVSLTRDDHAPIVQEAARQNSHALPLPRHRLALSSPAAVRARNGRRPITSAARSYLEKKDYVKARIEFRNAIQRKADLLPAWQALAQIDEHEQNLPALAGTLRRIIELAPNDLAATTKLARIYLLGNALDQALKLANTAGEHRSEERRRPGAKGCHSLQAQGQ